MLKIASDPDGSFAKGRVLAIGRDISMHKAQAFVAGNAAEWVIAPPTMEAIREPVIETTMLETPEKAVIPRGREIGRASCRERV